MTLIWLSNYLSYNLSSNHCPFILNVLKCIDLFLLERTSIDYYLIERALKSHPNQSIFYQSIRKKSIQVLFERFHRGCSLTIEVTPFLTSYIRNARLTACKTLIHNFHLRKLNFHIMFQGRSREEEALVIARASAKSGCNMASHYKDQV